MLFADIVLVCRMEWWNSGMLEDWVWKAEKGLFYNKVVSTLYDDDRQTSIFCFCPRKYANITRKSIQKHHGLSRSHLNDRLASLIFFRHVSPCKLIKFFKPHELVCGKSIMSYQLQICCNSLQACGDSYLVAFIEDITVQTLIRRFPMEHICCKW